MVWKSIRKLPLESPSIKDKLIISAHQAASVTLTKTQPNISANLNRLTSTERFHPMSIKRILTIGASTIPGEVILPHLMPKILQKNPDISLKLVITNSRATFDSVRNGEIEVGVIGTRFESSEVDFQTVIQDDRLVLIAPKGHPIVKKNPLSISDLSGQPFVNRESGSGT